MNLYKIGAYCNTIVTLATFGVIGYVPTKLYLELDKKFERVESGLEQASNDVESMGKSMDNHVEKIKASLEGLESIDWSEVDRARESFIRYSEESQKSFDRDYAILEKSLQRLEDANNELEKMNEKLK